MRHLITLISLLLFGAATLSSQSFYTQEWDSVYSVIENRQSRTALKHLDQIMKRAEKEGHTADYIQALVYHLNYRVVNDQDPYNGRLQKLRTAVNKTNGIKRSILHSYLAELYYKAYRDNRHHFQRQSRTKGGQQKNEGFLAWTLSQIQDSIQFHYRASLENPKALQKFSMKNFNKELIERKGFFPLQPTLYDFLAHRSLDYFLDQSNWAHTGSTPIPIKNIPLDTKTFLSFPVPPAISHSQIEGIRVLQELMQFHLLDEDAAPLVLTNIRRYQWLKMINRSFDYKNILDSMKQRNSLQPFLPLLLMEAINQESEQIFYPLGLEGPKNARIDKLCQEILSLKSPSTEYNNFYKYYKHFAKEKRNSLFNPTLDVEHQKNQCPETVIPIRVNAYNLDSLTISIFRIPFDTIMNMAVDLANKDTHPALYQDPIRKISYHLDLPEDYDPHTREIGLKGLPLGHYIMVLNGKKDTLSVETKTYISCTNLTALNLKDQHSLIITDRTTGNPVSKVDAEFYYWKDRNLPIAQSQKRQSISDSHGFIPTSVPLKNGISRWIINNDGDRLLSWNPLQPYNYDYHYRTPIKKEKGEKTDKWEDAETSLFFYTDRSIYRPGQTIHFMGLLMEKAEDGATRLLKNYETSIYLDDPNSKEIVEMDVKSNKYGTVSGEIVLPKNGTMETYTLWSEEEGETEIQVEAYKRPTFSINLKSPNQLCTPSDTIRVPGIVKCYSGAPLSDVKIRYTISKRSYKVRQYYQEVFRSGEVSLKRDGSFEVVFKDLSAVEEESVNYKIQVAVTDLQGETYEDNNWVRAAQKGLRLSFYGARVQMREAITPPQLTCNTLNDAPYPIPVTLTAYKLREPKPINPLRPWRKPDLKPLGESFSFYEGPDPGDPYTWESETLWKQEKGETNEGSLLKDLPSWPAGTYLLVATAKGPKGFDYKAKTTLTILDKKNPKVTPPGLLSLELGKLDKKRGKVSLNIYSKIFPAKALIRWATQEKKFKWMWIDLRNPFTETSLALTSKNPTLVGCEILMVQKNRLHSSTTQMYFPTPEDLNITLENHTKVLTPGSRQNWKIKVTNNKGKPVEAEFAASMYDASLDFFKSHNWNIPNQEDEHPHIYFGYKSLENCFGQNTKVFYPYPNWEPSLPLFTSNWYGFSFSNQPSFYLPLKRRYRSSVKIETIDSTSTLNISGTVFDKQTQEPMPGVTVKLKGSSTSTLSDIKGKFQIKSSKKEGHLEFSFIGYETLELPVNGTMKAQIALSPCSEELVGLIFEQEAEMDEEEIYCVAAGISRTTQNSTTIKIRGNSSLDSGKAPLYVVDGIPISHGIDQLDPSMIAQIEVLKGPKATSLYGSRGANGVVIVTTNNNPVIKNQQQIKIRKNLQETAFFRPQIRTNKRGEGYLSFTVPEALTKWNLLLLAHTKDLKIATLKEVFYTRQTLIVTPNPPRFAREGDQLVFATKVQNLDTMAQLVHLRLEMRNKDSVAIHISTPEIQSINLAANQSGKVAWKVKVPEGIKGLTYRVIATSGELHDSQEGSFPILPRKILVTHALPLSTRDTLTHSFKLKELAEASSNTTHKALQLEYYTSPAWAAVSSLPYLAKYPHECSEQLFSRYYANTMAQWLLKSQPDMVKNLKKSQKTDPKDPSSTPFGQRVEDIKNPYNELFALLDSAKLKEDLNLALQKLEQNQSASGGWPWFSGMSPNKWVTLQITMGLTNLYERGVLNASDQKMFDLFRKGWLWLDKEVEKTAKESKPDFFPSWMTEYLWGRCRNLDRIPLQNQKGYAHYAALAKESWKQLPLLQQAQVGLFFNQTGNTSLSQNICRALEENAHFTPEGGMHWKNPCYFGDWFSEVERQVTIIELFRKSHYAPARLEDMLSWLLNNKKRNYWSNTKTTVLAVDALLSAIGKEWTGTNQVSLSLGDTKWHLPDANQSSLFGEFFYNTQDVAPSMASGTIKAEHPTPSWGALYWQAYRDIEEIGDSHGILKVMRQYFRIPIDSKDKTYVPIKEGEQLKVGEKVLVRLVIKSEQPTSFVHLKDLRPACLEPVSTKSGSKWGPNSLRYYLSIKDDAHHYFMDQIPEGTFILEYEARVDRSGHYSAGPAIMESMYAPENRSFSKGYKFRVE